MDHRCLYGHRVPAAFTFAIQSRSCPTCGAPTVTITGYQAARKLTTEVGLEAVAAFSAIRVLESEWILTPVSADGAAEATPAAALAAPNAPTAPPAEEEEVVVEDVAEPAVSTASVLVAAPEARADRRDGPAAGVDSRGDIRKAAETVRTPPRPVARPEPRIVVTPPAEPVKEAPSARGGAEVPTASSFDNAEEDFFKST